MQTHNEVFVAAPVPVHGAVGDAVAGAVLDEIGGLE